MRVAKAYGFRAMRFVFVLHSKTLDSLLYNTFFNGANLRGGRHRAVNYIMTNADTSRALREECYLNEGQGSYAGYRDLIPLLLVLRYKALHSSVVFETAKDASRHLL